jgi:hypothetical protein
VFLRGGDPRSGRSIRSHSGRFLGAAGSACRLRLPWSSTHPSATSTSWRRTPAMAICPVCGAGETAPARDDVRDFEYFVRPARPFRAAPVPAMRLGIPGAASIGRRAPAFYPRSTTRTTKTMAPWRRSCRRTARLRGRAYRQLLGGRPGRLFDVGAGDCRHFDELRRYCDLECAGVEIQPAIAARGRARGTRSRTACSRPCRSTGTRAATTSCR